MGLNGQLHALAALPSGNELGIQLNRRLCGHQSQSGCCEEEKNFLPLLGIGLDHPAHSHHFTN
jgi:hypothetical protein